MKQKASSLSSCRGWRPGAGLLLAAAAAVTLVGQPGWASPFFSLGSAEDFAMAMQEGRVLPAVQAGGDLKELYPNSQFAPPVLLPYEGPLGEAGQELHSGMIMAWPPGLPGTRENLFSQWLYKYGEDPDLTGMVVAMDVHPPLGILSVGFSVYDVNNNYRAWGWNVVPPAFVGIPAGTITHLEIDPSIAGPQAGSTSFAGTAAFDVTQVVQFGWSENASVVNWTQPVPGTQQIKPWNYWDNVEVRPKPQPGPAFCKPGYTDYAPKGMPDFSQHQDNWFCPMFGRPSYCGPVALANCLWWFDSKFEGPGSVPPPAIRDRFPLVTPFGQWDDHDAKNVMPLVQRLAWFVDTDGMRTGAAICGTSVSGLVRGINDYLIVAGLHRDNHPGRDCWFETVVEPRPTLGLLGEELRLCEDVLVLLGFYRQVPGQPGPVYRRCGGHWATLACVDQGQSALCLSDPGLDIANPAGGNHNDAANVSHDPHAVLPLGIGGIWLPSYPCEQGCEMYEHQNPIGDSTSNEQVTLDPNLPPCVTIVERMVKISPFGAWCATPIAQGWNLISSCCCDPAKWRDDVWVRDETTGEIVTATVAAFNRHWISPFLYRYDPGTGYVILPKDDDPSLVECDRGYFLQAMRGRLSLLFTWWGHGCCFEADRPLPVDPCLRAGPN